MIRKKLVGITLAFSLIATGIPFHSATVHAASNTTVEYLNRGLSVFKTSQGMMISFRCLAGEENAEYRVYRDNMLIYTSTGTNSTCYLDTKGTSASQYTVETLLNGKVVSKDTPVITSATEYKDIPLSKPGAQYMPNDCSVGDVDGDGTYEIFVKWDPSNSKDNSQSGVTDSVYIDCYKLDGTKLWRINLGRNIRAGAHYTQFLVADFDKDGKAEMTCKTADGTIDGTGRTIGNSNANYRNSKGYILDGPEYYTLFDGATGKALDTVNYEPARGSVKSWGDNYGNRCDRYLGAVMNLDADHPSAVTVRGYYTRMTACAYDVVNKKLVKKWYFDSNNNGNGTAYGNGNHNCMPADVDNDGRQELLLGSTCIDHNGTLKWCANLGHGDALHVGDLDPNRFGLEVFTCHEKSPYGISLLDANTGRILFHENASKDTGRCVADNIWSGNAGAELWAASLSNIYNLKGSKIATNRPAINFVVYWDGDLERELLDGTTITKYQGTNKGVKTLLQASNCVSCNSTKATPCLSADLFGDWREEVIWSTSDGNALRIYTTPYTTNMRMVTLMQDPQYRNQVAGQNISYNQPPHPSFYLGSEKGLPKRTAVTVLGGNRYTTTATITPTESETTPTKESVTTPTKESVTTPTKESVTAPTKESITAPTKESITAPTKESITAPTKESITAPTKESVTTPTKENSSSSIAAQANVIADWGSGATVEFTFENKTGKSITNGWTIEIKTNREITNLWTNGLEKVGTNTYQISNPSWNPSWPENTKVTVGGALGSGNGSFVITDVKLIK